MKRRKFRIVSKDREPDGWGTRTDEILATPATLFATFNALGRWTSHFEVVSVEEIAPARVNPRKKCECGNPISTARQNALHDAYERRERKGKEKSKLTDAQWRELVESLDKCEACAKPPAMEREQRELRPFLTSFRDDDLRDRRRKVTRLKPLTSEPIVRGSKIPGEAISQRSNLGHLRPRLKTAGQALQNPWDRAPRDAGRRDFEAPTETKAVRQRQREIDNAPDPLEVVNRQAAGS
jgi:hypothetical protein